jgi:hypothetical protein
MGARDFTATSLRDAREVIAKAMAYAWPSERVDVTT